MNSQHTHDSGARQGHSTTGAVQAGTLLVIGGGGHAWVVTEAARASGWRVLGFFDDNASAAIDDQSPRLGPLARAATFGQEPGSADPLAPAQAIIALGSLELRARLIAEMGGLFGVVVHPTGLVSASSTLGPGTFVGASAVVQGRTTIGRHGIVNTGAIVEHDCRLGDNVHVAPRATLGGGVRVGANTLIGLGASVRPGVKIGSGCTVGVGAAVVRDVPDGATVVGVPAKPSSWWNEQDSA